MKERKTTKQYYDQRTRPADKFNIRKKVAIQNDVTKRWSIKVKIVAKVAPRSYNIKLENGRAQRRNQEHIRKVFALTASAPSVPLSDEETAPDMDDSFEMIPYAFDIY